MGAPRNSTEGICASLERTLGAFLAHDFRHYELGVSYHIIIIGGEAVIARGSSVPIRRHLPKRGLILTFEGRGEARKDETAVSGHLSLWDLEDRRQ